MDTISKPASTKRFWLLLFILIVLVGAIYVTLFKSNPVKTKPQIGAISVEVITATQQMIPVMINAVGSLTAVKQIDVGAQVAGQISKIGFTDGQEVHEGALLFQLDDADADAQLASALAQVRWSQVDYERKLNLFKQAAVAKQEIDLAKATLLENEAVVVQKQVQVQNMHLTAPFSGKISNALVSVGQYVSVGQTLATLVGLDHLRVVFSVSETYLPQLQLGQIVHVVAAALPGKIFTGVVLYIAPVVDITTRMVQIQADITNTTRQLMPGMFVNVSQKLGETADHIVIPDTALVASIEGNDVFVVKNDRVSKVAIQAGQRWNNQVEILSGLNVGDVIVIAGQQKLRDGSAVKLSVTS
ncbi:MAG: efflux RND transporter periplasmic adaptor subunit [Gammaproteobacteria bacterium]|nr:efflux RND transporter periplasmic adaptor subunit [Gammaproteobacteria bacterium]